MKQNRWPSTVHKLGTRLKISVCLVRENYPLSLALLQLVDFGMLFNTPYSPRSFKAVPDHHWPRQTFCQSRGNLRAWSRERIGAGRLAC